VFLTQINSNYFALKLINKLSLLEKYNNGNKFFKHTDFYSFYKDILMEKQIGYMSNECRFILKHFNSFQTESEENYAYYYDNILYKNETIPTEKLTSYLFHFMEFLNGGSLKWHLKKKCFSQKQVIFYSAQILCAILFLHTKKILHLDIKLENVLLDANGNAKLCDFSLCKQMTNEPITFEFGTPAYKSPESFTSLNLDYSFDFWSFGVCVFLMFTQTFPFENEEMILDINKTISDLNETRTETQLKLGVSSIYLPLVINEDKISKVACDFVSRLLNKNINERLGNKEDNTNIKNEAFFDSIDWNQLENGQIKPPINPNIVIN
jgi:serine/threonine protein kinase